MHLDFVMKMSKWYAARVHEHGARCHRTLRGRLAGNDHIQELLCKYKEPPQVKPPPKTNGLNIKFVEGKTYRVTPLTERLNKAILLSGAPPSSATEKKAGLKRPQPRQDG